MEVIYGLLPGMLLLGVVGVAVFVWAVRSGQYDDMDGAGSRMLMDDDDELPQQEKSENKKDD
jgi:cbb3-type cytochrome oxidase maturation protein